MWKKLVSVNCTGKQFSQLVNCWNLRNYAGENGNWKGRDADHAYCITFNNATPINVCFLTLLQFLSQYKAYILVLASSCKKKYGNTVSHLPRDVCMCVCVCGGGGGGAPSYIFGVKSSILASLRTFSLKRFTAGAFALPFRIPSQKQYDKRQCVVLKSTVTA